MFNEPMVNTKLFRIIRDPLHPYSYRNKFEDKELTFIPKSDEVVIRYQGDLPVDDIQSVEGLSVTQGINYQEKYAVLQVPETEDVNLPEQVTNVIPVMIDGEKLTRYFLPNEISIQFRELPEQEIMKIITDLDCQILLKHRTPYYYTVKCPDGKNIFAILDNLYANENVKLAEPSEIGFNDDEDTVIDDPEISKQWALQNTGQVINGIEGTPGSDIKATQGWNITKGASNVIVVVIDTGCQMDHPDLSPSIFEREQEDWNFDDINDPIPNESDATSHGTKVCGVIASNSEKVIGIAPNCKILPLKIDTRHGRYQQRVDAINYVIEKSRNNPSLRFVINCSWRMNGNHSGIHQSMREAIQNNIPIVCASGNTQPDGIDLDFIKRYPAIYGEVIAVAATDQNDHKGTFSNFGKTVSVSAPGVNILTTYPGNSYIITNGTSLSSPYVAGLAALLLSVDSSLTVDKIKSLIENGCDNISNLNPNYENKLGSGRINVFKSLSLAN